MKAFAVGSKNISERLLGNMRVQQALFGVMNYLPNTITFGVLGGVASAAVNESVLHGVEC